ncbi:MAG: hypothetical protein IPO01_11405 [Chitinophagaceae bacterium]|nr:hypothetical protein [Chitinophagaceae bacterium]MBK7306130.1 hypothetical protein [Chitinophagaceae bacterium]MBK9485776.1 hypothetical protein [Chitinophagaceae bacterium]
MKKIILASLLLCSVLFVSAASKENLKIAPKSKIEKKQNFKKPQWEISFSCDGGNTWGTFCCFNSQSEAQSFWNQNSAMLCGWTN